MPSKTSTQRVQERKSGKSDPKFKEPIYLHKSRHMPQIGDPSAPDEVCAHEFDDSRLPKKLLPHGQERRGCKTRDLDLCIKRDNKAMLSGAFQFLESEDDCQYEVEDFD